MKFDACLLYGVQSKKRLGYILKNDDAKFWKQNYVASLVQPYIDRTGKPRLIEAPSYELKSIQRRIKVLLGQIAVPKNVFSGIKGRSYVDNARVHKWGGSCHLFKIDLTAFFPSIQRETVYSFFRNDLQCAPDIAKILTNLTTIDLKKSNARDLTDVYHFLLQEKKINCTNHLISGAPTSQILSYLVNYKMFDELQALADKHNIRMSIYVDDVTFSSENRISSKLKTIIYSIVQKYNYQISTKKVKGYSKLYPKLVTGVIIDSKGNLTIKNSLREKIIREFDKLTKNPQDKECRQRLKGLLIAARQIDQSAYPGIYKFAFDI